MGKSLIRKINEAKEELKIKITNPGKIYIPKKGIEKGAISKK